MVVVDVGVNSSEFYSAADAVKAVWLSGGASFLHFFNLSHPNLAPTPLSISPSSAPTIGGTRICITGRHFGPRFNCLIMFGEIFVSCSYINTSAIEFVTPPLVDSDEVKLVLSIGGGILRSVPGTVQVVGKY